MRFSNSCHEPGSFNLLSRREGNTNPANPELASSAWQKKIYILMLACLTDLVRYCSSLAWLEDQDVELIVSRSSSEGVSGGRAQSSAFLTSAFLPIFWGHFLHSGLVPTIQTLLFDYSSDSFALLLANRLFAIHSSSSLTEILKIVGCDHCTSHFLLSLSPHVVIHRLCSGRSAGWKAWVGNSSKVFLPWEALWKHILIWKTDHAMGIIFVYMTCLWI